MKCAWEKAGESMILISACLAGRNVKYNGSNNAVLWLCEWIEQHKEQVLLVCPEVMGGLPTPRLPAEIQFSEANSGAVPAGGRTGTGTGETESHYVRYYESKQPVLLGVLHIRRHVFRNQNRRAGNYGSVAYGTRGQSVFGNNGDTGPAGRVNDLIVVLMFCFTELRKD